jgi:hypothetical protein
MDVRPRSSRQASADAGPSALAKHLTRHTKVNVRHLQHELTRGGVLLVANPSSPIATWAEVSRAHDAGGRAVVVAHDPLQWRHKRLPSLEHFVDAAVEQLAQQAIEMVADWPWAGAIVPHRASSTRQVRWSAVNRGHPR